MIKNKKILLTGAYGFLGSHLYESLKEKNKIYRIGRYKKNKKISLYNLKKTNFFFDTVIHCAGGSSVSNSITNPKEDYKKTVESTKILLKYIKSHQKKIKFVFISSASVFGNSIKKSLLKPISPYGKNKLISEKILIKNSKKLGFDLTIIRFFSLYGEGLKKQLLWDTINKLKKKKFEFYGYGNEKRSWMHINDAIKIIHLSIKNYHKEIKIINAPGKQILTNKNVVELIYKNYNIKNKPYFNGIVRKGDPVEQVYTNKDLKDLNFVQSINFQKGLNKYIKWFKKK